MNFSSSVARSNQAFTKYSLTCLQQFSYDPHAWRVPQNFHKPPQTIFSHISLENLFFPFPPHFFCIRPPLTLQRPPKDKHNFNRFLKASSYLTVHFKENSFFLRPPHSLPYWNFPPNVTQS